LPVELVAVLVLVLFGPKRPAVAVLVAIALPRELRAEALAQNRHLP
jgi:hypothetical protein